MNNLFVVKSRSREVNVDNLCSVRKRLKSVFITYFLELSGTVVYFNSLLCFFV